MPKYHDHYLLPLPTTLPPPLKQFRALFWPLGDVWFLPDISVEVARKQVIPVFSSFSNLKWTCIYFFSISFAKLYFTQNSYCNYFSLFRPFLLACWDLKNVNNLGNSWIYKYFRTTAIFWVKSNFPARTPSHHSGVYNLDWKQYPRPLHKRGLSSGPKDPLPLAIQ